MARFCTACGSALADEQSFCIKCGTPASAASASSAATPAGPVASGVVGPAPAAPPARSGGGSLAKILLIVVAVVIGLIVLSMGTCFYIGYHAKRSFDRRVAMSKDGSSLTLKTDQGPVTLQSSSATSAAKAATSDIPIYPGATPVEGSGATLSFGGQGGLSGVEYETTDPFDKVVAFYKEKFGSTSSLTADRAEFMRMDGNGMRTVTVSREESKTRISMAKMGK